MSPTKTLLIRSPQIAIVSHWPSSVQDLCPSAWEFIHLLTTASVKEDGGLSVAMQADDDACVVLRLHCSSSHGNKCGFGLKTSQEEEKV